jgi:hypothetical protein
VFAAELAGRRARPPALSIASPPARSIVSTPAPPPAAIIPPPVPRSGANAGGLLREGMIFVAAAVPVGGACFGLGLLVGQRFLGA